MAAVRAFRNLHAFMLKHLYDPPAKTLLLLVCFSVLFVLLTYMMYMYEYVMNSGMFGTASTNIFNEGPIGYGLLVSILVCGVFWVKYWLKLPKEIKFYNSSVLINSTETAEGVKTHG